MILSLYAKEDIHAGSADNTLALCDHTVSRSMTSNIPNIEGSAFKGAIKQHAFAFAAGIQSSEDKAELNKAYIKVFGSDQEHKNPTERSGDIDFKEVLPLFISIAQHFSSDFQLVISERAIQQLASVNTELCGDDMPLSAGQALVHNERAKGHVLLAMGRYKLVKSDVFTTYVDNVLSLLNPDNKNMGLIDKTQLIAKALCLPNNDFDHYVANLQIKTSNQLEYQSKRSLNLFNYELVPRHSLFATKLKIKTDEANKAFSQFIQTKPDINVGGFETTGHGLMQVFSPDIKLQELNNA